MFFQALEAEKGRPVAENPNFKPGHKYSILGIEMADTRRWVRWGLPVAAGLTAAMVGLLILS